MCSVLRQCSRHGAGLQPPHVQQLQDSNHDTAKQPAQVSFLPCVFLMLFENGMIVS